MQQANEAVGGGEAGGVLGVLDDTIFVTAAHLGETNGVVRLRAARAAIAELIEAAYPIANYQWPNEAEQERFSASLARAQGGAK